MLKIGNDLQLMQKLVNNHKQYLKESIKSDVYIKG